MTSSDGKNSQDAAKSATRLALIGCGALTELYYVPALRALLDVEPIEVAVVCDPNLSRAEIVRKAFPSAVVVGSLADVAGRAVDAAIVASPPRFHAEQAQELLRGGIGVLCEKPMAATTDEADAMIKAAESARSKLSVGLFRRFFPTSRYIRELILNQSFGQVLSFEWSEGGPFNWPAASPSFFDKSSSPGGVFADFGVHAVDLLLWWFGEPYTVSYCDDACGGLEANARADFSFAGGVQGSLRVTRDTPIPNFLVIRFERAWLRMNGVSANEFYLQLTGSKFVERVSLQFGEDGVDLQLGRFTPADSYSQSFVRQLQNFLRAVRGDEPLFVPGEEGIRSVRLLERCYAARRPLKLPWLSEYESQAFAVHR